MTDVMEAVLQQVRGERARQIEKWGLQFHDLPWWIVILGEEFGEAAKAVYEATTSRNLFPDQTLDGGGTELLDVQAELIQVAAVAVAALEDLLLHADREASAWRALPKPAR